MNQLEERVTGCFRVVFPDLSDEQITTAVRTELAEWDSLASLNLIAVLEEEFDVMLEDAVVESLDSYPAVVTAMAALG